VEPGAGKVLPLAPGSGVGSRASLGPRCRAFIRLRRLSESPPAETGQALRRTAGVTKSRKTRLPPSLIAVPAACTCPRRMQQSTAMAEQRPPRRASIQGHVAAVHAATLPPQLSPGVQSRLEGE